MHPAIVPSRRRPQRWLHLPRRAVWARAAVAFGLACGLAGCGSLPAPAGGAASPPDLILSRGVVHTMDATRSRAEAVAVRAGRIVAVGSSAQVEAMAAPSTRRVDLAGRLLLPGFHDAHIHPAAGGLELTECWLSDATSLPALLATIRDCTRNSAGQPWLTGSGWDLSLFAAGNAPRTLLDQLEPSRPAWLVAADGHSGWANSRALAVAGIDADTVAPAGGTIERDADGKPSGTLRASAMQLVSRHVPPPSRTQRREGLCRALARIVEAGITSVIEASASEQMLMLYREAAAEGWPGVRVSASMTWRPDEPVERVLARIDVASRATLGVRNHSAKVFVDGVLEGETAYLLAPYASGGRGRLEVTAEALTRAISRLDAAHVQVHLHAIGDGAVAAALDAFAVAARDNPAWDRRHHIAHLQLVHPDDYARFARLGITATFQALWAQPDAYILDINLPAVGGDRVGRMYPIGSLARAGVRIAGGSDWSVSSLDPLQAIEVGLTRSDADGKRPGILDTGERVSLDTMLAAYTTNAAWLMYQEQDTGSIEPGKLADLVVIDRDITRLPAADIGDARADLTLLGGTPTFVRTAADRAALQAGDTDDDASPSAAAAPRGAAVNVAACASPAPACCPPGP
jgi:hypothetical protein